MNNLNHKVLLIGDSCEDEYIYGRSEKINSEAPVPTLNFSRIETRAGMAGNLCLNLQALTIDTTFLTNSEKIVKTRFFDERHSQQLLRIDNGEKVKPLLLPISTNNFDAVLIYDYGEGYITESKIFEIAENATCPVFIKSKKTNLPNKKNCYIVVSEECYGSQINVENLILSMGPKGCLYRETLYPQKKIKIYDAVGTEEAFFAGLVYGYLKYVDMSKALTIANKTFSIASQNIGSYVLTEEDVYSLI